MTYSYEIDRRYSDSFPPFVDGCEHCLPTGWNGVVVPFATVTYGDSLTAFYHHGRCDRTWFTSFGAQWDHTWVRVVPEERRSLPPYNAPALPAAAVSAYRAVRAAESVPAVREVS